MTFIEYRYMRYFDWISFFLVLMLSAVGIVFIYSATYTENVPYSMFFKKQIFGMITGIIIYFICSFLSYETLSRIGYWLYFAVILLLIFTSFKGSIGMGGKRWIDIGIIKFQPSELANIFVNQKMLGQNTDWNEVFTGGAIAFAIGGKMGAAAELAQFLPSSAGWRWPPRHGTRQ